jgi:hypothetical protein
MKKLVDEIMINIFQFVISPLSLILSSRDWLRIGRDPYVKSEWLITKYGKSFALYNAARLGPTFIDIALCKILFARNVGLPVFFFQRLLMHLYKYNQKLIQLEAENNASYRVYAINKANTQLFHFLSYGTHVINYSPKIPLKDVKALISQSANPNGYLSEVDYENDKIGLFKLLELINFLEQER